MQDKPENQTGFELYSDRVKRFWPKHVLDKQLKVFPGPDTPTVKLSQLQELLLSRDLERSSELNWTKKELRFLDAAEDLSGDRVAFISHPRTGNTMTRKYVESVTGIYSGSDNELYYSNGV